MWNFVIFDLCLGSPRIVVFRCIQRRFIVARKFNIKRPTSSRTFRTSNPPETVTYSTRGSSLLILFPSFSIAADVRLRRRSLQTFVFVLHIRNRSLQLLPSWMVIDRDRSPRGTPAITAFRNRGDPGANYSILYRQQLFAVQQFSSSQFVVIVKIIML